MGGSRKLAKPFRSKQKRKTEEVVIYEPNLSTPQRKWWSTDVRNHPYADTSNKIEESFKNAPYSKDLLAIMPGIWNSAKRRKSNTPPAGGEPTKCETTSQGISNEEAIEMVPNLNNDQS